MNSTASNPPDLIASRISAGGGAARTVRYAVTSSTSQPRSVSPAASVSVAMSARGSSTRPTGSRISSCGENSASRPFGGLLPGGHQLRLDAEGAHRVGGRLTDTGDLDAAEVPGVQPVLGELLPDRPDRVDRGEDHPGVPAVDQALDRPLHLGRGARRLDRDRRHLARDRAVRAQPGAHRAGLLLGPGHEHLPAVQRAVLPPAQLVPLADALADGEHHPAGEAERRRDEAVHGRRGGVLRSRRCRRRSPRPPVVPSTPAASRPSRTAARSPASTASASEPRPTAAASASKSSVADVVDVGGGAYARQRHARRRWRRPRPGRRPAPPRSARRYGRPPAPP